jgi:hypothetical protein
MPQRSNSSDASSDEPAKQERRSSSRRIVLPEPQRVRPSKEERLRAMAESPLEPTMSWAELAALTREP